MSLMSDTTRSVDLMRGGAQREILPLTGIRGVAALWVVALHLTGSLAAHKFVAIRPGIDANLLRGGDLAVDVFFILSGFIITRTYRDRFDVKTYFVHRFGRIFPLNIVILASMAIGVYIFDRIGFHFSGQDRTYFDFNALPYYFLLLYVWLGMPIAWNGPTWSLSAELFAYFLFPFGRALQRYLKPNQAISLACAVALIQALFLSLVGFYVTGDFALARAVLGFSVGMVMSAAKSPIATAGRGADAAAILVIILIAVGALGAAVLPAACLIFFLAQPAAGLCHRLLATPLAVWLGRISYSIYLIHAPLLIMCLIGLKHFVILQQPLGLITFSVAFVITLLAVSAASFKLIENPSRYAIQGAWRRWTQDRLEMSS